MTLTKLFTHDIFNFGLRIRNLIIRFLTQTGGSLKNSHTLVFHIVRLAKKIQELNSYKFAPKNLSYSQAATLLIVDSQNDICQIEISKKLHLKPATIVTLIDELEKLKLVRREINLQNRRRYQIVLTKTGKELVKKIKMQTQKLENLLKKPLTESEINNFKSMLSKLTSAIETQSAQKLRKEVKNELPGAKQLMAS